MRTAGGLVLVVAVVLAGEPGCGDRGDRMSVDAAMATDAPPTDTGATDAGPSFYDPVLGNPFDKPIELDDARVMATDRDALAAGARPCRAPILARVSSVVDGDTIRVDGISESLRETVRLIGVDTPETNGTVECYGPEATEFTSQLEGHLVWLTFDEDCNDPFDRLLAYVHIGGGQRDVWQRQLVARGYGTLLVIGGNDALASTLSTDESAARSASRGLWGACR